MRTLRIATWVLALSLPGLPSFADRSGHRAKVVDLNETGTTRGIEIHAPQVGATSATATSAPDIEHRPTEGAITPRTDSGPVSGALIQVVERQMRKNQRSIDSCVGEELSRNPEASGTVQLQVEVAERKVARVSIKESTVGSAALSQCLTKAARTWTFNLKGAQFPWSVQVGNAAAPQREVPMDKSLAASSSPTVR